MTGIPCPICEDHFNTDAAVRDHAWDVHQACHHCGNSLANREALYAHWLAVHDDELSRPDQKRAEAEIGELTFGDRLAHQGVTGAVQGTPLSRRALLGGGVAASVALIGGAIAGGVFGDNGDANGTRLSKHAAAMALGEQPTLGPTPGTGDGTIIAFEDPSCPSCGRFEQTTFPELKSKLIDPGTVSFVFRAVPIVQPWGEPATLALEAVQARDEAAFWELKQYYYRNLTEIDGDNVYQTTRSFLANQTTLDADAVIQDTRQETYREDVDTNLQAADRAGVRGTPTFFLFKSGSFVTSLVGAQSYSVFANSLGV